MVLLFVTILSIAVIYFIVAFLKIKLCAICTAVSLTWFGLLIAYALDWHQDILLIGILMGGSVVGAMYKVGEYLKRKKLQNYWLAKLFIVIFGFSGVYLFLYNDWDKVVFLLVAAVLFGFLGLFFIKPKNQADDKDNRLDNCCG